MRVRVVRSVTGLLNNRPFPEVGEHDLAEHEARALIADGYAVACEDEKAVAPKAEKASAPAAEKRGK